jgi:hypothetical protein
MLIRSPYLKPKVSIIFFVLIYSSNNLIILLIDLNMLEMLLTKEGDYYAESIY